jgi:hypothetical protein
MDCTHNHEETPLETCTSLPPANTVVDLRVTREDETRGLNSTNNGEGYIFES